MAQQQNNQPYGENVDTLCWCDNGTMRLLHALPQNSAKLKLTLKALGQLKQSRNFSVISQLLEEIVTETPHMGHY